MGIWRQSCDQLVAMLVDYSQDLLSDLRRFQELGNKVGAEIIRDCCVNCFAHLAILCETLRKMEPFSPAGVEALCDSSLVRLSELAQDACREEYTRHDLLLRVCATHVATSPNPLISMSCRCLGKRLWEYLTLVLPTFLSRTAQNCNTAKKLSQSSIKISWRNSRVPVAHLSLTWFYRWMGVSKDRDTQILSSLRGGNCMVYERSVRVLI